MPQSLLVCWLKGLIWTQTKGFTLLMVAANHGHTDVVRTLLSQGAAPDLRNLQRSNSSDDCRLPGSSGSLKAACSLACRFCSCRQSGTHTFSLSCMQGHAAENTTTMVAARAGHVDLLKVVIGAAANVNQPEKMGHTALERAAAFCHVDTVKLLLSIGADYKSASTVRRYCSSTCYYHDALFAPSAHACLQKHSKSLLSLLL